MNQIWAWIENGEVVNTVYASDSDVKDPKYLWINITNMNPQPGIGWKYDGANFIAPPGFFGE